ncbi:hypothetical protein HMPREF3107_05255 [Neisseria sp. HMSC31F04]|uniref:DUF6979 family protein n=1 Tax=Neisseria sp. HMSC31F04 TaxID=1581075 RepID=UPI0008A567E8|nr:hypothetical protein [Neisseria sp. HMSC31F04]OFT01879.1 hypothetical protein HMPREF3107_05255 [Neisseria sp. HMSC31F04]
MNLYGKTAVKAVELFAYTHDIKKAWTEGVQEFTNSHSARVKGCPKNTFFGLCYAGQIKGISIQPPQGRKSKNAEYAILAIHLLKKDMSWANKKAELWAEIQKIIGEEKKHNSQLDVVIALWNEGLIQ